MKLLGMEKHQYSSIFVSYLLSILSLRTSLNMITMTLLGPGIVWDTMLVDGLFYFTLIATFVTNGVKLNGSIVTFLIFFISAGAITLFTEPLTAAYVYGTAETAFLNKPIITFFIYCFLGFVGASYLEDTEYFFKIFEKFSYITVVLGVICYYFSLDAKEPLQYMTFSYDMLLHVTFLSLRCISKFNWKKFICAVIGVFVIFIAGCRGALVSCFMCVFIYILTLKFKNSFKKFVFCAFCVGIIGMFIFNFEQFLEMIGDFLIANNINSRTVMLIVDGAFFEDSGRSVIQQQLIEGFNMTGHGLYSDRLLTGSYAHNIVIELIYDFGIILGPTVFLGVCGIILAGFLKADEKSRCLICALFSTGFIKLFLSGSYLNQEPSLYVLVGFCILILNQNKNRKKEVLHENTMAMQYNVAKGI